MVQHFLHRGKETGAVKHLIKVREARGMEEEMAAHYEVQIPTLGVMSATDSVTGLEIAQSMEIQIHVEIHVTGPETGPRVQMGQQAPQFQHRDCFQ
jgi:hypothetical protein